MSAGKPQLYLIYGTDEVRIHKERAQRIAEALPVEHRPENLTEIEPAAGRTLSLGKIGADLMSELSTPSFFPEVPRVIVVEQLAELFTGGRGGRKGSKKGKGKSASGSGNVVEAFQRYLERDLRETDNILILTAVEEPDKRRNVSTTTKLFKAIQSVGQVSQHKEPAAIFALTDGFSQRDLRGALTALAKVLERDDGVPSVYRMLTRQVRFLIQAKLLERQRGEQAEKAFADSHFPQEKGLNLLMEHPFVNKKVRGMARNWTLKELNAVLQRLERFTKTVYPSVNDVYVRNPETELEMLVIESCGRVRT